VKCEQVELQGHRREGRRELQEEPCRGIGQAQKLQHNGLSLCHEASVVAVALAVNKHLHCNSVAVDVAFAERHDVKFIALAWLQSLDLVLEQSKIYILPDTQAWGVYLVSLESPARKGY